MAFLFGPAWDLTTICKGATPDARPLIKVREHEQTRTVGPKDMSFEKDVTMLRAPVVY